VWSLWTHVKTSRSRRY